MVNTVSRCPLDFVLAVTTTTTAYFSYFDVLAFHINFQINLDNKLSIYGGNDSTMHAPRNH